MKTGECSRCPPNTFLLEAPALPTDCSVCPHNAVCFGGNEVGPQPGFWRSDESSLTFLPCFYQPACLGSLHPSVNQDAQFEPRGSCAANYEGDLCSQCSPGFTRNSRFECSECPPLWQNLLLCGALAVFGGSLLFFLVA